MTEWWKSAAVGGGWCHEDEIEDEVTETESMEDEGTPAEEVG